MMKIAMTGANGFLGRRFIEKVVQKGHSISALVGPGDSSLQKVENVSLVHGSLENSQDEARRVLEGSEVFIHMAALGVQSRDRSWDKMIEVNCAQPLKWLDVAKEVRVNKVIAIGTALEYEGFGDLPGDNPYPDGDYPLCDEYASLECSDPYGATKAAGGIMLRSYAKSIDLPLVYLRLASMYGPNDDPKKLIPAAVYAAQNRSSFQMSAGEQVRDWLHVDDAIEAILKSVETESKTGIIYNVGTGEGISIRKLVEQIFTKCNAPVSLIKFGAYKYRKNEKRFLVLDGERFMKDHQWHIRNKITNDSWN